MSLGDIGIGIVTFILAAGMIAGIVAIATSKPVKIIGIAILVLVFGTVLVMGAGFIAAKIIAAVFSVTEAQSIIALGVVGSLCAAILAAFLGVGLGMADLEMKLQEIVDAMREANSGKSDNP